MIKTILNLCLKNNFFGKMMIKTPEIKNTTFQKMVCTATVYSSSKM